MALDAFHTAFSEGLDALAAGGAVLADPGTYGAVPYGRKGVTTPLMMAGLGFDMAEGAIRAVKVRRGRRPPDHPRYPSDICIVHPPRYDHVDRIITTRCSSEQRTCSIDIVRTSILQNQSSRYVLN